MRPNGGLSAPSIFWLLLLIAPLPLVALNFTWMWQLAHYQYFPFLIGGIAFLIWERWDRKSALPSDIVAFAMLAIGIGFLVPAIWIWSPWLGTISWVFLLGAWLKSQNQTSNYWGLLHLWPPLFLLIRLPMQLDTHLMSWLQRASSRLSSLMLDLIELPHRLQGNVFELSGGTLFIGEACSGVQSLFTMLFCSMFLVSWLRRRITLLPIYLLVAFVWAGCLNVMRIVAIAVAQEWYGVDLLHGWQHDLLGYTCLALAIGLLASTDRLIQVLAFPVPASPPSIKFVVFEQLWNAIIATRDENRTPTDVPDQAEDVEPVHSPLPEVRWSKAMLAGAGSVLLLSMLFQVRPLLAEMRRIGRPTAQFWMLNEDVISGQIDDFVVSRYEHVKNSENLELGSNADVWEGTSGGMQVRVVVSQPYYEWHNLAECYGAHGWLLNEQTVIDVPVTKSGGGLWPCATSSWVRTGEHAILVFSGLDSDGNPVSPPHTSVGGLIGARMEQNRWRQGIFNQYMMIQVWADSPIEYTEEQREHLRSLHLRARDTIRKRFVLENETQGDGNGEAT